jgi:predicted phosphohydrolase
MKLFAISDLHFALSVDKPMDVFGSRWADHVERIIAHWHRDISDEDTILIGGDISWGNSLEEAESDLGLLNTLPGEKILLRGNHDYWWTTVRKMEQFCRAKGFQSLRFLRNNALSVAGFHVCGARGWVLPQDKEFSNEDEKILNRENIRLELSLTELRRLRKNEGRAHELCTVCNRSSDRKTRRRVPMRPILAGSSGSQRRSRH